MRDKQTVKKEIEEIEEKLKNNKTLKSLTQEDENTLTKRKFELEDELEEIEIEMNSNINFDNLDNIIEDVESVLFAANRDYTEIMNYIEKATATYMTVPTIDTKSENRTLKSFLEENLSNFDGQNYNYTTDETAIDFLNKAYSDKKAKINQIGGSPEIKEIDNKIGILKKQKETIIKNLKENNLKSDISKKNQQIKEIDNKIKVLEEKGKQQFYIEQEFLSKEEEYKKEIKRIREERKKRIEYIQNKMFDMYEELQNEYKKLLEKIDLLEKELEKLKEEKEKLEQELTKIDEEIEKVKKELEEKEKTINKLCDELSNPDITDEEKERINKEIEELTQEKSGLETNLLELSGKQSDIRNNIEDLKIEEKEKGLNELKEKEKDMASKLEEYKKEFEKYGFKPEELKKEYDSQAEKTDEEIEQELSDEFNKDYKEDKPETETSKDDKDETRKQESKTPKTDTNAKQQSGNNANQVAGGNGVATEPEKKEEKSIAVLDKSLGAKAILEKYLTYSDHKDRKQIFDSNYSVLVNAIKDVKPSDLTSSQKKTLNSIIDRDQRNTLNDINFSDEPVKQEIYELLKKYAPSDISQDAFDKNFEIFYNDIYSHGKYTKPNILEDLKKASTQNIDYLNDAMKNFYEKVRTGEVNDKEEIENFEKYIGNIAKQGLISTYSKKFSKNILEKFKARYSSKNKDVDNLYATFETRDIDFRKSKNLGESLSKMNEEDPKPISKEPDIDEISKKSKDENDKIFSK